MASISFTQNIRHWLRLSGYLLAVALIGGGLTGGGLSVLEDMSVLTPGGPSPAVGVNFLAGAGLVALGSLVMVAGVFVIVLNVIADGVRVGVENAQSGQEPLVEEEDESPEDEQTEDISGQDSGEESTGKFFDERESAGQESPQADRQETNDPQNWKKEIESSLSEEGSSEEIPTTDPEG